MTDTANLMPVICVSADGVLKLGPHSFPCTLGSGGIVDNKTEGDHATPAGCYPLRRVMYRADRMARPLTQLPLRTIHKKDGWCDAPAHAAYNRLVRLPMEASHEALWREDHLYDIVVEVGYNDDPPIPGKGSAIFMHVAHEDGQPTEGCVALQTGDLLQVLALCGKNPLLRIESGSGATSTKLGSGLIISTI